MTNAKNLSESIIDSNFIGGERPSVREIASNHFTAVVRINNDPKVFTNKETPPI